MDLKSYELGYLLTPLLPEDKVPEAVEQIKSLITGALGEVKQANSPRLINLAYPIKRVIEHKGTTFRDAYFGTVHFAAPGEGAQILVASLKKSATIIRHLLITAREEPLRPTIKRVPRMKVSPVSMTAAAIDKEIENLIHVS